MAGDEAGRRRPRRTEPPLYDARFEHDACGVGFVADAGGGHRPGPAACPEGPGGARPSGCLRGRRCVVGRRRHPAAAGALGRRAGDGRRAGSARGAARPGVCSLFLPRRASEARLARDGVRVALAAEGLPARGWRPVPFEPGVLGPQAAAARPIVEQVLVPRPRGMSAAPSSAPWSWHDGGWSRPPGRLASTASPSHQRRLGRSSTRAWSSGARLAELYPDLAGPLSVSHAVFHQRYATNTMPTWPLAQPFRLLAHNGEINTVRGNREQIRGRAADRRDRRAARRLQAAGPLLSPGVSDSASLDEAVELLVQTGWTLEAALRALMPDVPALRRGPSGAAIRTPMIAAISSRPGMARRPSSSATAAGSAPCSIATAFDRWPMPSPIGGSSSRRPRPVPSTCPPRAPSAAGALAPARCSSSSRPPDDPSARRGRSPAPVGERRSRGPRSEGDPAIRGCGPWPTGAADARWTRTVGSWPGSTPSGSGSTSGPWSSTATSRSGAWVTTRRRRRWPEPTDRSPTTFARPSHRSPTRPSMPSASARSSTAGSSSGRADRSSAALAALPAPDACGSSGRSWPTSRGCCGPLRCEPAASTRPGPAPPATRAWRRRWSAWRHEPWHPPDAASGCSSSLTPPSPPIGCPSRPCWRSALSTQR